MFQNADLKRRSTAVADKVQKVFNPDQIALLGRNPATNSLAWSTDKETSTSDTPVLRRYSQETEYTVYEHIWDGF